MANGLRNVTCASIAAQRASRSFVGSDAITRNDALKIAKRAAAAFGLKTAKIAVLDQLFAFSQAVDWVEGPRPIIWPSNAALATRLGISVSTLKYHLSGLVEAGLIAYADGPTYQRRGRRDNNGRIVEAFGIDLSPIAVRFDELKETCAAYERERKEWQRVQRNRTITRRAAEAVIAKGIKNGVGALWQSFKSRLDNVRTLGARTVKDVANQAAAYARLQHEADAAFEEASDTGNLATADAKIRPLLSTDLISISNSVSARENPVSPNAVGNSVRRSTVIAPENVQPGLKSANLRLPLDEDEISLGLIRSACPALNEFLPGVLMSWDTFTRDVGNICILCSADVSVFFRARAKLGRNVAAAALVVTFQKYIAGLVSKPTAYLRELSRRGEAGTLDISRSLRALARANMENP